MEQNFDISKSFEIKKSFGCLDMLYLMSKAYFVLRGSGRLQDKSVILKKPCLTLRYNTEQSETVEIDAKILVEKDSKKINYYVKKLLYEENF